MSRRESQYLDIVDEFRTRAYIDGRNAAREGWTKDVPAEYESDSICEINWLTGYEDWTCEQTGELEDCL